MEQKNTQQTGQASMPKPVFALPEKQVYLENSPKGVVTVFSPKNPYLLKHEYFELMAQAKYCGCWIKGLGLSALQLGIIDDHVDGVTR